LAARFSPAGQERTYDRGHYTSAVAEPARRTVDPAENVPGFDPTAVERSYAAYRARRLADARAKRARRAARLRFAMVMLVLLGLCIYLALVVWHEIQRLFGL
jgi:hypothetical protein